MAFKTVFRSSGKTGKAKSSVTAAVDLGTIAKDSKANLIEQQKAWCIEFAEAELAKAKAAVGNGGSSYNNQTFNLSDSYVALVYYKGKRIKTIYDPSSKQATQKMTGYERMDSDYGRREAINFAGSYQPTELKGFEIVIAACAVYGVYLEKPNTRTYRQANYVVLADLMGDFLSNGLSTEGKVYKFNGKIL